VTRKVASKQHEYKENVDTESALRNEMSFALPPPKTPFAESQIEMQVQTIPFQAPAFKGTFMQLTKTSNMYVAEELL